MTFQSKISRLVLVSGIAAAIAAPSASASTGKYVQIGGDLVKPTQLSEYQAQAGVPVGAHLVQVGGKLVRPDRVSAYQAHASQAVAASSSSDEGGFGWGTAGIGIGLVAALLAAIGAGVQWRRGRLGTA